MALISETEMLVMKKLEHAMDWAKCAGPARTAFCDCLDVENDTPLHIIGIVPSTSRHSATSP